MERSLGSSPGRSVSASSLSSSLDTSGMEVEDLDLMDSLVADVAVLSDSLNRLAAAVDGTPPNGTEGTGAGTHCVWVHEALRDTSARLKELLERYLFLRCSDILSPASNLVHAIKGLKFDSPAVERAGEETYERAHESIHKLQAAVAERVGDYLTWEMSHYEYLRPQSSEEVDVILGSRKESAASVPGGGSDLRRGRLISRRHSAYLTKPPSKESLSTEEMDGILGRLGNGLELAFERCKGWSRYCKELLNAVNRRIALELDHAKAVHGLAKSAAAALQDDHFMPLQSIYLKGAKVEADFYHNSSETMKKLYDYKYIKPLETRKAEHDRRRKELETSWKNAHKAATDAQTELRKAKDALVARDVSYRKARDTAVAEETGIAAAAADPRKLDKSRQRESDLLRKKTRAESDVQRLQRELGDKLTKLEAKKTHILSELRELIYQCDQTTKACTVAYFQALSGLWSLLPMQYQSLSEAARQYTPGMEYMQYVQNLPSTCPNPSPSAVGPPWVRGVRDDDSSFADASALYRTPQPVRPSYGMMDGSEGHGSDGSLSAELSSAIASHSLAKNRVPQRCAHCDTRSFFLTFTCSACRLSWHQKCLSQLRGTCDGLGSVGGGGSGRALLASNGTIFGVPLGTHLDETERDIPVVVQRCVEELDKRGRVKGLYRVCGTKSKIDSVCGEIEAGGGEGPYEETSPSVLASVLKLYLRQLPQSLLTDVLHGPCLDIAKEFPSERELGPDDRANLVHKLRQQHSRLPQHNQRTLRYLILHLKRMTWFESETSMNAMNLGIVFGPTLMGRDDDSGDSLQPLLQLPAQTRLIELLISHAYDIYDIDVGEEVRSFEERTGISVESSSSGGKDKDEALRRGSSLSSLSIATTPDPHSPHSTSDDHQDESGGLGLGPTKIPLRGKTLSLSSGASQRSPATSEDSAIKSGGPQPGDSPEIKARQKSATPDLLKGRQHRAPLSSPSSSQDNDQTLHDASTSDEDPSSMVFKPIECRIAALTATGSKLSRTESLGNSRGRRPDKTAIAASKTEASTPEPGPRRKPRFERARPVRRNSRPRNYTTSIFVSPSKFDAEAALSEDGRRRSSEDLPSGEAGTLRLTLNNSKGDGLDGAERRHPPLTRTITEDGDSVHILLSAKPEDLSYV